MNRISVMAPVVAMLAIASLTAAAEKDEPRTISTTGEAVVYVAPDEAILNVGVETFSPQLDKAKEENDTLSAKLLAAIKGLGIQDKHIQTANMEIEVRYKDSSRPSYGINGYHARRAYAITLKDVKQFEKLVDTCLKHGANRLMGFQFRTTELRKHRDNARSMAIKAAKEKAVALANDLACKVGAPRTIHEGGSDYYGGWPRINVFAQNSAQVIGGGAEGGETMPLGQIGIRANVSVTFDLIPQ